MDENEKVLSKIREFESALKRMIIETYGKFLPEDKISLLNLTNYTTNALLIYDNSDEIRGELARRMLDDVIDMRTIKEVTLADGNTLTINYGYTLEDTLINYYATQLAEKYHFNIDQVEGLNEDLETVKQLYEKMGNSVEYSAFNEDAVKLLNKANIKELTEKYDQKEIDNYFNNVRKVTGMAEMTKEEQNKMLKEAVNRDNSIQIVWLHEKKHIKYTDPYGKVHLVDISNSPKIEEFYQTKLASLAPGEKLDAEEFYHELLTYYANEIELQSTNDIKEDELNSRQIDMLEFIKSNPNIQKAREQDIMLHNSDMDIHVMNSSKDIITTEDRDEYVEANIISDGSATMTDELSQKSEDISNRLISKEEYIRLNNKLFNGEELSAEEMEALRRAAPVYSEEVFNELHQQTVEQEQEKGTVLKPKDNYNTGFTVKTFALYFVVLTILIATIITIILLR